ncbi:MAG: formylglycine-generating enzyme family protein, partial [Planctomycetota bacterium]
MSAPSGRAGAPVLAAAPAARESVRVGSLEVDRAPVTNARYAAFVEAEGHRPPAFWPNGRCPAHLREHPVVGVDLFDALAFARWAGGRLPSEEEWTRASGLAEPRGYVWGDVFDGSRCNTHRSGPKGTTPVGSHPGGTAPSGCVDLCGNVWEMTSTPAPGEDDAILVKGGSWYDFPVHARLESRFRSRLQRRSATVGFRLVYDGRDAVPEFLPREVVDRCVGFRRARSRRADAPVPAAAEFEAVVAELRGVAEEH